MTIVLYCALAVLGQPKGLRNNFGNVFLKKTRNPSFTCVKKVYLEND